MHDEEGRVVLFLVAQTQYANWEPLPDLHVDVLALNQGLTAGGSGYRLHPGSLLNGGNRSTTEVALTQLADSLTERDRVVLYWTGHGAGQGDHYLITEDSPKRGLTSFKAIRADALGEVLAKSKAEKIVVFVDTCYSSQGARAIAEQVGAILSRRTYAPGQRQFFAVIPSAHSAERAEAGVFCRTLLEVLTGSNPAIRTWTDRDLHIPMGALKDALLDAMQQTMGEGWQPPLPVLEGWGERFLPNPRYQRLPPVDAETSRQRVRVPEALEVAALGIDAGEAGRYFTPRRVMDDVAMWLASDEAGLTVLTGSPGAGKSAVLGHIALRSARGGSVPNAPSLTAVVHARGKTRSQVSSEIETATNERPVLLIDAVDEAAKPMEIAELAAGLVRDRNARVLVGSRKSVDGRPLVQSDPYGYLREAFGNDLTIVDLDEDRDTTSDIADYVRRRLEDSHHRATPALIQSAAERVAKSAAGSFLYARVVSRTLQHAERLDGPLPDNQLDAFAKDLRERFPQQLPLIDMVLSALAWSRGNGVSREAWTAMANAVGEGNPPITDRDVSWALDHVGWHILETDEAGQTVYRLIHQAFADYFRARVEDAVAVERRIARHLANGLEGTNWLNADPYRCRHLAEHAAAGGVLDELITQPGFLAVAEPTFLLSVLPTVRSEEARHFVHAYRRALVLMRGMLDTDRPAILRLAAHQHDPRLADRLQMQLSSAWQSRWAYWRALVASATIRSIEGGVDAGTVIPGPKGEPILVYVTGAEVFAIDPTSPATSLWRVTLATTSVRVLTSRRLNDEVIIAAGDESGWLHLMRVPNLSVVHVQAHAARINAVAFTSNRQERLVATGGDEGDVALWTIPEGRLVSRARGVMQPTAMAATDFNSDSVVIVTGDDYGHKRVPTAAAWSVPALSRVTEYQVPSLIAALHVVELEEHRVALGSRLGDLVGWNLMTGAPIAVAYRGDGEVKADVFMPLSNDGAHAIVATCYGGGQFHRVDVTVSGDQVSITASPWIETGGGVWLGPIVLWNQPYLVSAGREVRIWEVRDLLPAVDAAPQQTAAVRRLQESYGVRSIVAAGDLVWFGVESGELLAANQSTGTIVSRLTLPGGRPVGLWSGPIAGEPCLLVGSYEGSIHCLDPATGTPRRPAISVGGPVMSLAVTGPPAASHLAITTRSAIDKRSEYHVRLWALPSFVEIDTRPANQNALRAFGVEAHWMLTVPNYEREKPFKSVTFLAGREGPLVAAGGNPQIVMIWNVASLECAFQRGTGTRTGGSASDIASLCELVGDGDSLLAAGTDDGSVIVWDLEEDESWTRRAHAGETHVAAIGWRGERALASGGEDGVLRIWTIQGAERQRIRVGAAIWALASLSGGGVAVGTHLGLVVIDHDQRH